MTAKRDDLGVATRNEIKGKSDGNKSLENETNDDKDEKNGMVSNFYNEEDADFINLEELVVKLETRGEKHKSSEDQTKFKKVLFRTVMKQQGTRKQKKNFIQHSCQNSMMYM